MKPNNQSVRKQSRKLLFLHTNHSRLITSPQNFKIMQAGGWGDDRVLKDVYRHTLEESKKKMSNIAINYFETMQHEIQHGTKKTP